MYVCMYNYTETKNEIEKGKKYGFEVCNSQEGISIFTNYVVRHKLKGYYIFHKICRTTQNLFLCKQTLSWVYRRLNGY
jgi:hypothetical protein